MTKAELKEKTGGVLLDVLITEKGAKLCEQSRYLRGTRRQVREATWKKAIVTVKEGERVELA